MYNNAKLHLYYVIVFNTSAMQNVQIVQAYQTPQTVLKQMNVMKQEDNSHSNFQPMIIFIFTRVYKHVS